MNANTNTDPKADCFIDVFEAVPTLEAFVTQRG
eukprot:CAMPEP_0118883468 /NCGR_PEP_ID=MMETSP1163-20130328/22540_1 /TAXON_ID=124430 /ORGANISM="Phaeomonas parva, Strain CCMP2877" /LENGTH=32 /DNA_ID= /DNA_START= /DNA_END= /DNA_ORIENTATION=